MINFYRASLNIDLFNTIKILTISINDFKTYKKNFYLLNL